MKNRNNAIDAWKGIAIISVIGIHACEPSILMSFGDPNHLVGLLFRGVFNFAVGLFFAFSGYFSPDIERLKECGIFRYYYNRLLPIWIPYFLWTCLYLLLNDWHALLNIFRLTKALLLGTGIGIGYFVIVLSSLIVIHPLLAKAGKGRALQIGALLSAVSVAVLYYVRLRYHDHPYARFPFTALPFTTWAVFFYLGFYLKGERLLGLIRNNSLTVVLVSLFIGNLVESVLLSSYTGVASVAASQVKATTFLYTSGVCIYALIYSPSVLEGNRSLIWIGRRSYVIYLCHMLFLSQVSKILVPLLHIQIIYIPSAVVASISLACLCILVAERILPPIFCSSILGIKK